MPPARVNGPEASHPEGSLQVHQETTTRPIAVPIRQRHRGAERLQDMRFHVSSLFVSLCTFRFESRWGYFFRPYTVRVFTTLRDSVLHSCNIGVPVRSIPPLFDQPVECACSLRIALGVDMEIPFGRDAGGAWPSL